MTKPVNFTAEMLRAMAEDEDLINAAHLAVEDQLVALRDSGISWPLRANGLVIRDRDYTPSPHIRIGTANAIRTALRVIADYLEKD